MLLLWSTNTKNNSNFQFPHNALTEKFQAYFQFSFSKKPRIELSSFLHLWYIIWHTPFLINTLIFKLKQETISLNWHQNILKMHLRHKGICFSIPFSTSNQIILKHLITYNNQTFTNFKKIQKQKLKKIK